MITKGDWIGIDLDGTLAYYAGWRGKEHIGEPIPEMLEKVKNLIARGQRVKIFTARVSEPDAKVYIEQWAKVHGLEGIEITNIKDFEMIELWDDRAVTVIKNSGQTFKEVLYDFANEMYQSDKDSATELKRLLDNMDYGSNLKD